MRYTYMYFHMMKCYSVIKRSEVLIHAVTYMNLENIILRERSWEQKITYYDSIYMRYLEYTNPQKQKVDCWGLRELEGNGETADG